jgi:hypothetical protein
MRIILSIFLCLLGPCASAQMLQSIVNGGVVSCGSYSDNFARANGGLGANWVNPPSADGNLTIISDNVFAAVPGTGGHNYEYYAGGCFGSNQFSTYTIVGSAGGFAGSQFSLGYVRATTSSPNYYNSGIDAGSTQMGIHNGSGYTDFYTGAAGTTWSVGDVFTLVVAGTAPTFFWMQKNGSTTDGPIDNTFNYTGGGAGVGIIDSNVSPTVGLGSWSGGTEPNFNPASSGNFTGANSPWLGVDWWFPIGLSGDAGGWKLSSNAAVQTTTTGNWNLALRTTPFPNGFQITLGAASGSDWVGVVARLDPTGLATSTENDYAVLCNGGNVYLYARESGSWVQLGPTLGTHTLSAGDTIDIQASGTNPVLLKGFINGVQIGSTYTDTTLLYAGTYSGFTALGAPSNTVTHWVAHP